MENETDKIIKDQMDALPADVKEAIARVPWKDRVRDIGKRENLNVTQIDSLETETMFILFGFLTPDSYVSNIMSEVGIGDEQAERISKLVNDEIIKDIEKQFEMIDALAPKSSPIPAPIVPTEGSIPKEALPATPTSQAVEAAPEILPEVVPGQSAHDVPPGMIGDKLTQMTSAKAPEKTGSSYPKGIDPYHEPIE